MLGKPRSKRGAPPAEAAARRAEVEAFRVPSFEGSAKIELNPTYETCHFLMSLAEKARREEGLSQAPASGSGAEHAAVASATSPETPELGAKRPRKTGTPLMSPQEAAALTVPFAEVKARLREHMLEHGVAIVSGVVPEGKLHILEECMRADLQALVAAAAPPARPTPNRCEGLTREGAQCKNTAQSAHKSAPLIMGGDRCATHQEAKGERAVDMGDDAKERFELSDWSAQAIELLGSKERVHGRGLPQGSFAWTCRLLPSVRACFAALYPGEEDDLLVGLDMPFFAPAGRGARVLHPPPHVDQNTKLYAGQCYQGILYVSDATSDDASTTVVLPGSHKELYRSLGEDPACPDKHYIPLRELAGGTAWAAWEAGARRLPVPKGSLVLWDSRLAHTGWRGGERLAQPVCYEPKHRRPPEALARKVECVLLGLSTSHSAGEGRLHVAHGSRPSLLPMTRVNLKGRDYGLRPWIPPLPLQDKSRAAEAWYAQESGAALEGADALIDPFIAAVL